MARSNSDKEAYSLISEYVRLYREKYGVSPTINKYKEKWAFISLAEDFGYEGVDKTLGYYFKLTKDMHPLGWFVNNFSTLHISRMNSEKDAMLRADQRKKTQELRAEYLNGVS
jgi:hypothetical protein